MAQKLKQSIYLLLFILITATIAGFRGTPVDAAIKFPAQNEFRRLESCTLEYGFIQGTDQISSSYSTGLDGDFEVILNRNLDNYFNDQNEAASILVKCNVINTNSGESEGNYVVGALFQEQDANNSFFGLLTAHGCLTRNHETIAFDCNSGDVNENYALAYLNLELDSGRRNATVTASQININNNYKDNWTSTKTSETYRETVENSDQAAFRELFEENSSGSAYNLKVINAAKIEMNGEFFQALDYSHGEDINYYLVESSDRPNRILSASSNDACVPRLVLPQLDNEADLDFSRNDPARTRSEIEKNLINGNYLNSSIKYYSPPKVCSGNDTKVESFNDGDTAYTISGKTNFLIMFNYIESEDRAEYVFKNTDTNIPNSYFKFDSTTFTEIEGDSQSTRIIADSNFANRKKGENRFDISFEIFNNGARVNSGNLRMLSVQNSTYTDTDRGDGSQLAANCEQETRLSIGWLLCGVVRASYEFLDGFLKENLIDGSLKLDSYDSGAPRSALQAVWSGFNGIATFMFVIAFIAIIYSAASGNIFNAYDVKTMLPRLLFAAVLAQLSFVISLFILRFFNILGENIGDLILFPVNTVDLIPQSLNESFFGNNTSEAVIIAGLAIGAVALILNLGIIGGALIGVALLWFIFIARNIALTMLIVISPLAFAANVLPGTQNWFKQWWKWFIGLLALYPIMVAFLAAGRLVSAVMIQSGGSNSAITALIAIAATFIPYFFAPKVLTMAGGVVGTMGNMYNSGRQMASKIGQGESAQRLKAQAGANKLIDPNSRFGQSKLGKKFTTGTNAVAGVAARGGAGGMTSKSRRRTKARFAGAYEKMQSEDVQAANSYLSEKIAAGAAMGLSTDQVLDNELGYNDSTGQYEDLNDSVMTAAAANRKINETQDYIGVQKMLTKLQTSGNQAQIATANSIIQGNVSALAQKAPHLLKGEASTVRDSTGQALKFSDGSNMIQHTGITRVAGGIKPEEFASMKPDSIASIQTHLRKLATDDNVPDNVKRDALSKLSTFSQQAKAALDDPRMSSRLSKEHSDLMKRLVKNPVDDDLSLPSTEPASPNQQPGASVEPSQLNNAPPPDDYDS